MPDVVKELTIAAPIHKVWAALTEAESLGAWMDDDSIKIDLRVGGKYALFGGETSGKFTHIEPNKLLEYSWRQKTWKKDWPDSLVRWELDADGQQTRVKLTHSGFPSQDERDSHEEGWDEYWLEPMREYLEASGH